MIFKTKPYEHQQVAFDQFKNAEYFALFADMGTGKSKISIDIAVHKFLEGQCNSVLIIAPNHVHNQWIDEQFPTHCGIPYTALSWQSSKMSTKWFQRKAEDFVQGPAREGLKVLSVNVEAFQSKTILPYIGRFVKSTKPFIIIDEATRIKSPTAIRSKNVHRLNKYGHRCILTGTPTAKSPFDLWSLFEFLRADYFNCNYFVFQHRYGILMKRMDQHTGKRFNALLDEKTYGIMKAKLTQCKEQRGGTLMPDDYEMLAATSGLSEKNIRFIERAARFSKFKRMDELREEIAQDVFSVKKTDCLDLPPKIHEVVPVDMGKEQKRVYSSLRTQMLAEYDGQELTIQNKISLTTRLMQVCGGFFPYADEEGVAHSKPLKENPKLAALLSDLDEIAEGEPIIIWAQFVAELQAVHAELKKHYSTGLYYGGTPDDERKEIIAGFKDGSIQVFIGNPVTAGFGLNFQHCNIQLYYSNSFRTEVRLQAEDRTHRMGSKGTNLYKDYVCKGTIDEKVHRIIAEGKQLNEFFSQSSLKDII